MVMFFILDIAVRNSQNLKEVGLEGGIVGEQIIVGLRAHVFRLQVIHGKVEEVELPEKADILISEPMGESFSYHQMSANRFAMRTLDSYRIQGF
jgi:hypothetical protein